MYHVNPKTGDAGPCKAQKGKCPFGGLDEHFTSVEGARAYYEELQRTTLNPTGTSVGEEVVVDIPEHNLQLAKDSIAAANRRLEKAGVEERFTYEVEEYMATEEDPRSGLLTAEPRVKLTLNTPSVKYEGYTFMAAVEKAEAGFVVKAASGVNLGGYSPDSLKCEACGKTIGRQKTYLVEDSESRLIQIGSSCVKNYFGVEPKGLWALTYDPIARARNNDRWGLSTNPMDRAVPTEELLAYALAVSNGGENFMSASAAANYGGVSTADNVRTALWGKDNGYSREIQEAVPKYRAEAKRILQKLKAIDQSTDYGRNMAVIAAGEWTRRNHMNILIGGLSTLAAERRQAKKDAHLAKWGTPAAGFIGAEKEKISGKKMKVYSVYRDTRPDPNPYSNRDIDVTRITFRDEDNHEVVWWASRDIPVEEDDEVTVKSGTIKKLNNFRGVDQTVLTRVRLEGL